MAGLQRGLNLGAAPKECQPAYSNSNYVLLGIILDRLYGEHHSAELYRVLDGMGLAETYYEKHYQLDRHPELEGLCHSYVALPGRDGLLDVTWADDGYGFANGGLIGTPQELARFYSLLFSDRVAAPMASLEEKKDLIELMTTPNELGLGLGIMPQDGWLLHPGSIGGYSSLALYSPQSRTAVVFYPTTDSAIPRFVFR